MLLEISGEIASEKMKGWSQSKKNTQLWMWLVIEAAQYATWDQSRNNSRKNEGMEPKQKEYPAVDVTGDRSKSDAVKSNNT